MGGGTASTGGGAAAGGDAGGSAVGGGTAGAGGGMGSAGGAAGGGTACGCRNGAGQCQVGDSPFACGSTGAMCTRCGMGEQCVNGGCVVAACGPGTCTGCCGRGTCITPSMQSTIACGLQGTMCNNCPRGQDCLNGTCQQAQPCGPMTCATGCCIAAANRCLPPGQQSRFTCGTGGGQCSMCPGGSQCNNGTCVGSTVDAGSSGCDAVSCASGCCAFGQCIGPGMQSNFGCGIGGQMCMGCQGATSCRGGVCVPNTTSDGGIVQLLPTGSACTAASACEGNCIEEAPVGQPSGFPGGYCTGMCSGTGPCGNGTGICVSEQGQFISLCRSSCTGAGMGQGSCRTGYVCTLSPNPGALVGFCRPSCQNMGFGAQCPQGQQCQTTGYCQ